MGNCTGIFQNCKGDAEAGVGGVNDQAVKKIDREQIQKALAHNNQDFNRAGGVNQRGNPAWGRQDGSAMYSDQAAGTKAV